MTWTQLCALIDQSTIMDPTHGVHSTLSVKRGAYVNSASSSSLSSSYPSAATGGPDTNEIGGPEIKRQSREMEYAAYSAEAAPTSDGLVARIDALAGSVESLARQQSYIVHGRYTPFSQKQELPRY